jgi:hypothetical protein
LSVDTGISLLATHIVCTILMFQEKTDKIGMFSEPLMCQHRHILFMLNIFVMNETSKKIVTIIFADLYHIYVHITNKVLLNSTL